LAQAHSCKPAVRSVGPVPVHLRTMAIGTSMAIVLDLPLVLDFLLVTPATHATAEFAEATTNAEVEVAEQSWEADLLPDKKDDAWTTSSRFKKDLVDIFPSSKGEKVIELGAHVGHCTRVLAHLFGVVIAVEHSEAVLDTNIHRTADLANVVHLHFHSVLDDWAVSRNLNGHCS